MSDLAIRVENLSKQYNIGIAKYRHDTLRDQIIHDLKSLFKRDGQNLSLCARRSANGGSLWALSAVSFDVKYGEVVGIIGRNGAGKSTLLKLLSRITKPTTGCIKIRGRVGSLLEVGTGFHPELTGRENIYLNGAILGMTRAEIHRKFDEIVAFAEVEKFINTPVKRYSSGMYLRLAFAVAAHLEPEILIVDEVLAVGDVVFQKKCLGKMSEVAAEGRTILFVSHNMDAIQQMCSRSIMLDGGWLVTDDFTANVVSRYLSNYSNQTRPGEKIEISHLKRSGTGEARFVEVQYSSLDPNSGLWPYSSGPLEFLFTIHSNAARSVGSLAVFLCSQLGTKLLNADTVRRGQVIQLRQGLNRIKFNIEKLHLNPGVYRVGLWLADPISSTANAAYDHIEFAFEIEVIKPVSQNSILDPHGFVTCQFHAVEVD
jgi:lipopolysaccharide transport system ATP-binding protein